MSTTPDAGRWAMTRPSRRSLAEQLIDSPSNYWIALVGDLVAAVVCLLVGIRLYSGSMFVAGAAVVAGFTTWTALEYTIHRWVLHGPASMAQRAHARHHGDGAALVSAPAFTGVALAAGAWAVLAIPLSSGTAALAMFGLYAGYNYYALLHHFLHHHHALVVRVPALARRERAHRLHHSQRVVNYGVTTSWWDLLFGSDGRWAGSAPRRVSV